MNYSAKDNAHTGNHMVPSVAITIISAYLVITLIGWFGNGNVVIATIKNRNLRSRCNILIAVQSFSEIFHQSAHLITAYFIYSGNYFIPLKRCFQLQLIPNLFMQFASALMLSIGFDRIFGVCFSNRYRKMRKNMYIFAVMIPAGAYSIMQVAAAYHSDRSEQLVVCTVVTIHTGWSQKLFMFGGCLLNITIVAFYVVMWIIIRHEGSKCQLPFHQ
ncbi:hypothetical protein Tcan_00094 [Toxocara canis]|uniref:G-protein coupled receptors family 1 profile domain-containing protein n=1 Tax=Toxocara canis TaxID=6265 RepID=A0A0B2VSP8_TOXCA|nr:hypothetical protein Tcan_00094 [Toxocara canis]